jgi:uncharacterized membrane protein
MEGSGAPVLEPGRLAGVDVLRGAAILQMIAFHLCYDLNHFSWIHADTLGDPAWIAWRTAIVAQFLFLVGVSLALRAQAIDGPVRPNWRRWLQIAACAALVSAASRALFGPRWIWFGVLHFVALAQLLALPLARRGAAAAVLGAALVLAGWLIRIPAFADDALSWIGFSPAKPQTEDYVPLVPWSGVVLLGVAAADLWRRRGRDLPRWRPQGPLQLPAFLGRWPLTTYMIHQPILFGLLWLLTPAR